MLPCVREYPRSWEHIWDHITLLGKDPRSNGKLVCHVGLNLIMGTSFNFQTEFFLHVQIE